MQYELSNEKKYYSTAELKESGLSYYKINKLVQCCKLIKICKGKYENPAYSGEESDFSAVSACAPKGVFCMLTAARFYGLTTYLPDCVDIAIERSMKISTLPEWPSTRVWYFPTDRYETGKTIVEDAAGTHPMYDMEKVVIDILYYRNKIGIEETKEVLKNYLTRENRNLIKLHRYAEALGCKKILETYLEVLL